MLESTNLAILVGAALVAVSIFTSLVSYRVGAPLLLLFLAVGLMAGEDGIGRIYFDNAPAAYLIGSVALAIILFDAGFDTSLHSYRVAAAPALVLATIGVLITTALVAVPVHFLLGFPWLSALLIGSIVSSTDAAAVFLLLRVGGITIRDRVRSLLEIESGSNDPVAIFLTIGLVELIQQDAAPDRTSLTLLAGFVREFGIGIICGIAGSAAIVTAVNRLQLEAALYPLVALSLAVLLFAATTMIGGSGFLAVYIAGLIAGNRKLRARLSLQRFQSGMTWLSQITMFLTLGLLATPSQFPQVAVPAIVLALTVTLVARPVAAWLCLAPFGFQRKEIAFIGWVGLRGAVSILLAIVPIIGEIPGRQDIFNMTFLTVLASLLVQGWTVRPLAKGLDLVVPPRYGPVERVELDIPGDAAHEIVAYRVEADSHAAKIERLPRWAKISVVVRESQVLSPEEAGRLKPGDRVYLFAEPQQVRLMDGLFASPADVDASGFYGEFPIDPETKLKELGSAYDFKAATVDAGLTVRAYFEREFGGRVGVGDRLRVGSVALIVRTIDDNERITELGLALEPQQHVPSALHRLPGWASVSKWLREGDRSGRS